MFKLKRIVVLISLVQCFGLGAQNLVPNPSFEINTSCPTGPSQINLATPWYGTNTNSEYFNSCAGGNLNVPYSLGAYQYARTGNAYAGQWWWNGGYVEYIQVQLTNTLVSGDCYFVKFYVNYPNTGLKYACNNFAAHISSFPYSTTGPPATSYTPQIYLVNNPIVKDTLKWTEIAGIYTATGGESHITIGNFKSFSNTDTLATFYGTYGGSYYYIEDVSVEQITTPQWQLKDTMILGGDSVLIGPLYSGLTCNWFDMIGSPIGSGAGIWVKPTTTTSYVLQQTFCNTTFSDTMTVYVSALGIKDYSQFKLKVYPNPVSSILYISSSKNEFLNSDLEIINVLGETILRTAYKNEIDVSQLSSGYYTLKIITSEKHQFHSKFIKE